MRKFSALFFLLLAYLVVYPYIQHGGIRYSVFRAFGAVVTLLSIYAVSFRRSLVLVASVLAIPTLVHRIVLPMAGAGPVSIISVLFSFAFDVFVVVVIFRRVFKNEDPTAQTVFGALCIYLQVGFSFAGLYSLLAAIQPRAFYLDPVINVRTVPDRFDLIYYSFGTMTCLGAAGITPVSDQARSISIIQALLGVLYLAVLIARLLGAYNHRRITSVESERANT